MPTESSPWPSLLRGRARPARRPAPAEDPADMGTCFGLELTLMPADVAAGAAHRPAPPSPDGWWRRLAARKAG